jgi:hypothetical protein
VTTLIAVYTSEGCVGRCDAKCYDAASPSCACICGGRNHGAGRERALENTRGYTHEWLERYAAETGHDVAELRAELGQLELDGA